MDLGGALSAPNLNATVLFTEGILGWIKISCRLMNSPRGLASRVAGAARRNKWVLN